MSDAPSEATFIQRVSDAVEQLRIMSSWEADQKLEAEGWTTFFAVDADIVLTYGAPRAMARRTGGRPGYAQVFDDEQPELSFVLAERLMDHIFFDLSPQVPLLILPPIDREVRSILDALTGSLGREPSPRSVDHQELRAAVTALDKFRNSLSGTNSESVPHDILNQVNRLIALRSDSDQTRYLRLTNLLELERIVRANDVSEAQGFPPSLCARLAASNKIDDIYEHAILSEIWHNRILNSDQSQRLTSHKRMRLIWDSYALAQLQIWNQRLAENRIRIIYVSGSLHVLRAAAAAQGQNDINQENCVRHPRYFLASRQIFDQRRPIDKYERTEGIERPSGSHQNSSSQFLDWVVTFLSDCKVNPSQIGRSIGKVADEPDLKAAAKEAFKRDAGLGIDLRKKWRDYLEILRSSYEPPSSIVDNIVANYMEKKEQRGVERQLDAWSSVRKRLNDLIDAAKDRTWDACFREATRTGLFVGAGLEAAREERPSRLVPPLRFDRWEETDAFVQKMSAWRKPSDVKIEDYRAGLKKIENETGIDYPYAYYLSHAALFAARGDWRVGAILSIRAIDKAVPPGDSQVAIGHGREANYLAAHCLRHRARSQAEMDVAKGYLTRARRIYIAERKITRNLVVLRERFVAEELAFQMTKLFHKQYAIGDTSSMRPSENDWIKMRRRLKLIDNIIVRSMDNASKLDASKSIIDRAQQLRARISANIIMASIVLKDVRNEEFRDNGHLLHRFVDQYNGSFYLLSLDFCWRAAVGDRSLKNRQIDAHFSERNIHKHSVLPYDLERYGQIAEATRQLKASPSRSIGS